MVAGSGKQNRILYSNLFDSYICVVALLYKAGAVGWGERTTQRSYKTLSPLALWGEQSTKQVRMRLKGNALMRALIHLLSQHALREPSASVTSTRRSAQVLQ